MPFVPKPLPSLVSTLHGPNPPKRPILILYASADETGRMWCGDCRRVETMVKEAFSPDDAPTGVVIEVGDKPTWKDLKNEYRSLYGINSVPTLIKLDSNGKESARLVDGEITEESLKTFIQN